MASLSDPTLKSWVPVPEGSDFPIQNIPFGIFSRPGEPPRACTRIGDTVICLATLAYAGLISAKAELRQPTLNAFIALGKSMTNQVREDISVLLREGTPYLRDNPILREQALFPVSSVTLHLPIYIPNYTDFYSSVEHATNVGIMFRGVDNALMPNWKHIPVGYHGRASSITVSGTPFHRPKGQMNPDDTIPVFGPTKQLDFELEMAFVVGKSTPIGDSVSTAAAENFIFGLMVFNDWSARDIQRWEYVPLGPFLGKNFFSSASPWIVTLEALEPFRVQGPVQDVLVLPYLESPGAGNFDINLDVFIKPLGGEPTRVSASNFKYMYWNMRQQLAHHTVNGCNLSVGDVYASGTISGHTPDSYGSMLELAWKGTKPLKMNDGSERKFILDGDTVIMHGYCEKDGLRLGFGEVSNEVLPSK
jgi:fumarylacetoacetase